MLCHILVVAGESMLNAHNAIYSCESTRLDPDIYLFQKVG
jgi:hypothetical protein